MTKGWSMEAHKVLVKDGDVAVISCPNCGKTRKLPVEPYRRTSKRDLRIRCSCTNVFCLCLEYRKDRRKPVRLLGRSINLSNHRVCQDIIIKNISMGGVGFCPFTKHRTRPNDRLLLSFTLNDVNSTAIDADVSVRSVNQDYIGCEFTNTRNIWTPLGFFLLG